MIENHSYRSLGEETNSEGGQTKVDLMHTHLQSTALFGNSTGLEYFYVDVYLGSHRQREGLIVDTGSNIVAVPCANYCQKSIYGKPSCGTHLNNWYDIDQSYFKHFYQCKNEQCQCTDGGKCRFGQSYLEGSSYEGFWVRDLVHFGDFFHA